MRAAMVCVWSIWGLGMLLGNDTTSIASGAELSRESVRLNSDLMNQQTPVLRIHLWNASSVTVTSASPMILWNQAENRPVGTVDPGQFCVASLAAGRWRLISPEGDHLIPSEESPTGVIEFRCDPDSPITVFRDKAQGYYGSIRLIPSDEQPRQFAVVNAVDIENYLAGVIGSEMYPTWNKAALQAQSIASRTYALYQIVRREGRARSWDIGSDQMSQMYTGLARRHGPVAQAVADTRGIVLAYGPVNQEKIFPAYYSAICGGHTEDAEAPFGNTLPPLKGRDCPYCQAVADPKLFRWPAVELSKTVVSQELLDTYPALKPLKNITDIRVIELSDYGRARRIELTGSDGRKMIVRAEEFRLAVSSREKPVRSSWFTMEDLGDYWRFSNGRGWGHGVGLCQCGAQQMAKLGKDCIEILNYYYPQAALVRAY